jgi:hypothetical protein
MLKWQAYPYYFFAFQVFMSKSGKNLTPPDLKLELRSKIFSLCDSALCEVTIQ